MKELLLSLWIIVISAGGKATALFLIQGGFGAGGGWFDRALVFLGSPWSLVPWPDVMIKSDFLWLVMLPIMINVVIVLVLTLTIRRWYPAE
jgi:hypothetical protein